MSPRTIGVMGRVLDPGHGLGLYCISLLRNMLMLDPGSRYVIWMRTASPDRAPVRVDHRAVGRDVERLLKLRQVRERAVHAV